MPKYSKKTTEMKKEMSKKVSKTIAKMYNTPKLLIPKKK